MITLKQAVDLVLFAFPIHWAVKYMYQKFQNYVTDIKNYK